MRFTEFTLEIDNNSQEMSYMVEQTGNRQERQTLN